MKCDDLLRVENLEVSYDKFKLQKTNLNFKKGSITGIIGQNGAGKSTLIKSILNLIKRDYGKIYYNSKDIGLDYNEFKEDIGFVSEELNLYNNSKVKTLYKIIKRFYTNWDDKMFNNLMKSFDIDENKKIKELSKGMRIKFLIILALSHNAKLLILDEPTSGLDPIVREDILDLLNQLANERNCTIIFSSHITEDIEKIAKDVIYISNGHILMHDKKDNILNKYKKYEYEESLPKKLNEQCLYKNNNKVIFDKANIEEFEAKMNLKEVKLYLDDILIMLTKQQKSKVVNFRD